MSNAKTGLFSALGALVGGFAGAQAGKYAAQTRPRYRYAEQPHGPEVEDAMVVGAAAGAVLGAFIAGAATGEPAAPAAPPQLKQGQ